MTAFNITSNTNYIVQGTLTKSSVYNTPEQICTQTIIGTGNSHIITTSSDCDGKGYGTGAIIRGEYICTLYDITDGSGSSGNVTMTGTTATGIGSGWSNLSNIVDGNDATYASSMNGVPVIISGYTLPYIPIGSTITDLELVIKAQQLSSYILGTASDSTAASEFKPAMPTPVSNVYNTQILDYIQGTWGKMSGLSCTRLPLPDLTLQLGITANYPLYYANIKVHYHSKKVVYRNYINAFCSSNTTSMSPNPGLGSHVHSVMIQPLLLGRTYEYVVEWVKTRTKATDTFNMSSTNNITTIQELR